MRQSIMSVPAQAFSQRRLAAFGLSLCVLWLEVMLVVWWLLPGVPGMGAGTGTMNGHSAALTLVNFQATAVPRAAHHPAQAQAQAIRPPRVKLAASGPPAALQDAANPDRAIPPDAASAAAFAPLSGQHGAGDPCSLAQDLATDLQASPWAQQAVERVPARSLSMAGALLLWDGHWVVADGVDPGSAMLRQIVLREIAAAKPECLAELNPGPEFLFINGGARTVTIVIGSGQWRWGDLATSQ